MIWTEKDRGTRIKFCDTCGGCSAEIAAAQGGFRLRAHDLKIVNQTTRPSMTATRSQHPFRLRSVQDFEHQFIADQ